MRAPHSSPAGLIGARLRALRKERGLAQGELAAELGISASYLNLIEHERRRVSPALNARLTTALGVEPDALDPDAGEKLARKLAQFSATTPTFSALHARAGALHARFPDWSALITEVLDQNLALRARLARHEDRISHDPELSSNLHHILGAVASIRATAEILAETEALSGEIQARFHRNLADDSARLSERAAALVRWLDPNTGGQGAGDLSPKDAVKIWADQSNWDLDRAVATRDSLPSEASRREAALFLEAATALHSALPTAELRALLAQAEGDLWRAAAQAPLEPVAFLERLAFEPDLDAGFALFDGAGQILRAKGREGFRPPHSGAACALWPVFAPKIGFGALQGHRVSFAPDGGEFDVYVAGAATAARDHTGPAAYRAAMLVLSPARTHIRLTSPPIPAGTSCRFCPRAACAARSEPSLHLISAPLDAQEF